MTKTLDILKNTDYEVTVSREKHPNTGHRMYEVQVTRESDGDTELIGHRTLSSDATKNDLEWVVRTIIETDKPSLTGTYTGGEKHVIRD